MSNDNIYAKVVLDSIVNKSRVTTFEVRVPLLAWVQILTHRAFSRNAASNRAIPTKKLIESATFIPDEWPQNDKGMSPSETVSVEAATKATILWKNLMEKSVETALALHELGIHKEIANRVLSPFLIIKGLITSTEWQNFIDLRTHKTTQRETRLIAEQIRDYFATSELQDIPRVQYHLPFIKQGEEFKTQTDFILVSAARCARVSYLNHDGKTDLSKDIALAIDLLENQHMSPFEHVVLDNTYTNFILHHRAITVLPKWESLEANMKGVVQFRKLVEIPQNKAEIIASAKGTYSQTLPKK